MLHLLTLLKISLLSVTEEFTRFGVQCLASRLSIIILMTTDRAFTHCILALS